MNAPKDELRHLLTALPPGPVEPAAELERLLAACWDTLPGCWAGGMKAHKLLGRTEDLRGEPPLLGFRIERHGGAACGSTRAEMQCWEVDLERWEAALKGSSHRQLKPMAVRLQVKPLAAEIGDLIQRGEADPRLKWLGPDTVRVLIGNIIPATGPKATTTGRRKRLKEAVSIEPSALRLCIR